ncbi:MAG TPA: NUDIX domain-containing protein, partial [Casimicrobiaceae bacterium]|nr:NUDIX domain-containing protein [Casimicrobiaceae bacterium]
AEAFADCASTDIATYTQGLMDVGATICTRTRPHCDACPVARDCIAHRDGRIDTLPSPRPRKELPRRSLTVLLLQRGGDILLEQRPPMGVWSGLWSLPELPCDGDPVDHVAARFQAGADMQRRLPVLTHAFTHFVLTMQPVAMTVTEWPSTVNAGGLAWFTRDAAIAAALPSPIRKLLRAYA